MIDRKILLVPVDPVTRRIVCMYEVHPTRHDFRWWYGQARTEGRVIILSTTDRSGLPVEIIPYVGTFLRPEYQL